MDVKEAGKLGGWALLEKRGRGYFAKIGIKGQLAIRSKYPGMASIWGARGGRPRKLDLVEISKNNRGGVGPA